MGKLLNLFRWRRRRLERDFDRELRYHVERRIDDLTGHGLTREEARRRASLELGGLTQVRENVRDAWVWRWLDDCRRDLRHAGRTLLRMHLHLDRRALPRAWHRRQHRHLLVGRSGAAAGAAGQGSAAARPD